ncbi:MAG: glucuronate isomerase [Rhizomicrobium sp.]
MALHPDRFFPSDPATRAVARALFARTEKLPILSPHGHTDPKWFATDAPFEDATSVFLWPDHYVTRMLYSQGIALEALGLHNPSADRARHGSFSPRTIACFAARRRGYGSTMSFPPSSASTRG